MRHTLFAVVVGVTAGLQNVVEADDIALDIHIRIGDRIPDTGLGSQVHHHVKAVLGEAVIDQSTIRNAAPDEGPPGLLLLSRQRFDLPQAVFLDGHIVIVVHVVQTHDLNSVQGPQQLQHQIGADKTGSAGNQDCFMV